jgi:alcohol dehydrogenase
VSQDANQVHRAAQVAEPGAAVQVVPVRESAPGVGEVRIDVEATGICGADIGTVRNPAPATGFPVTPGHEVAGVIAALGPQVQGWGVGGCLYVLRQACGAHATAGSGTGGS